MTRRADKTKRKARARPEAPAPPRPVDVVDGIPDRAARAPLWRYLLLVGLFLAWLGFLIYCAAAGAPAGR